MPFHNNAMLLSFVMLVPMISGYSTAIPSRLAPMLPAAPVSKRLVRSLTASETVRFTVYLAIPEAAKKKLVTDFYTT